MSTIYSRSGKTLRGKIQREMLSIVEASVRRSFPLLTEGEVAISAQRIVAEALSKETHIQSGPQRDDL